MAEKKVGILIKEARTAAKLTQEKLASAAGENLTAALISKCERGDADLTNAQLKKIAVACGVTQASLLNAPKNLADGKAASAKPAGKTAAATKTATKTAAKTASATKTDSAAKTGTGKKTSAASKTDTAKKTAAKTSTAAKTAAAKKTAASKTPSGATSSMKVTASEKKLVEAYRDASSDLKKIALKVLKGEYGETITTLLGAGTSSGSSAISDGITSVLGDVLGGLLGGK